MTSHIWASTRYPSPMLYYIFLGQNSTLAVSVMFNGTFCHSMCSAHLLRIWNLSLLRLIHWYVVLAEIRPIGATGWANSLWWKESFSHSTPLQNDEDWPSHRSHLFHTSIRSQQVVAVFFFFARIRLPSLYREEIMRWSSKGVFFFGVYCILSKHKFCDIYD